MSTLHFDDYSSSEDSNSDTSPKLSPLLHQNDSDIMTFTITPPTTMTTAPDVNNDDIQQHLNAIRSAELQRCEAEQQRTRAANTQHSIFTQKISLNPTEFTKELYHDKNQSFQQLKHQQQRQQQRNLQYLQLQQKYKASRAADGGHNSDDDYLSGDDSKNNDNLSLNLQIQNALLPKTNSDMINKPSTTTTSSPTPTDLVSHDDPYAKTVTSINKKRMYNNDATSESWTGSWGNYSGESALKDKFIQRIDTKRLTDDKKNGFFDGDDMIIDEKDLKREMKEKLLLQQREVSNYYLPVTDPLYAQTSSSTDQFISHNYNTNAYINDITAHSEKYIANRGISYDEATQLQEQAKMLRKFKKDMSSTDIECYDSYEDIMKTTAFKIHDTISSQAMKQLQLSQTRLNPDNNDILYNDLQLRSFLDPPHNVKINYQPILLQSQPFEAKVPQFYNHTTKATTPTYTFTPKTTNSNGVCLAKFFPYTAQYLLAGCLDGSVKLYTLAKGAQNIGQSGCIRDYHGHTKGLKDLQWVDGGKRFVTCGLDGWVKLWDTETGKVLFRQNTTIGRYRTHATPMASLIDKDGHNGANVIVGCGDGRIVQYDFNSNRVITEYTQMQQAITTIIDVPGSNTRNFMVGAADGQIFVFQSGIQNVFQHVMHHGRQMITRATVHPSEQFILANTHGNDIVIFKTEGGKVRVNRKKTLTGLFNAGYSIGLTCSPDGKYVVSGDGHGKIMVWDFKTGRTLSSHKAHNSVCADVDWAWNHKSMMCSASWDGSIKVWQ